jgi:hypothetical protein
MIGAGHVLQLAALSDKIRHRVAARAPLPRIDKGTRDGGRRRKDPAGADVAETDPATAQSAGTLIAADILGAARAIQSNTGGHGRPRADSIAIGVVVAQFAVATPALLLPDQHYRAISNGATALGVLTTPDEFLPPSPIHLARPQEATS